MNQAVDSPVRTEWMYRAAGIALVVLTAGRSLFRLDVPAFWFDEAVTWGNITGDWRSLISRAARGEDLGGFLHSGILKVWALLAGSSEYGLRFPSVVFALAMLGVLWTLGRLLWGRSAGLCAAATATLLPGFLDYSREARGYSLLMLATAVALLGVVVYRRQRRWGGWLIVLATCVAIATHIFGLFVWAGVAIAHLYLIRQEGKPGGFARDWLRSSVPLLPALTLALIWILGMRKAINHFLSQFWLKKSVLIVGQELLPLILPIAGALILLSREPRRPERRLGLTLLGATAAPILIGPVLISALARGDHHFILFRYFLSLLPLAALAGGYILSRLRPPLAVGLVLALLALTLFHPATLRQYTPGGRLNRPTREMIRFLRDAISPSDRVLVGPFYEYLTLHYYGFDPSAWGDRTKERPVLQWKRFSAGKIDRRTWLVLFHPSSSVPEALPRLPDEPCWSGGILSVYLIQPDSPIPR